MNTISTETKFAYRHKPTNEWACFKIIGSYVEMWLLEDFDPEILYNARNIIEEDLMRSTMNGKKYAALHLDEFELIEVEVQYKIKQEYVEIKIHESPTGWPN